MALQLQAIEHSQISGNWHATSRTLNNGTETIEKEYLTLNPNGTFSLVLLVSLKKDEAFVKDLRIEIGGNWESRDNTLVYVIKTVNVPNAKEVYLISQKSLENLAANFKYKYENDRIHINKIQMFDDKNLVILSEQNGETKYVR
jgi:hypothetical protein